MEKTNTTAQKANKTNKVVKVSVQQILNLLQVYHEVRSADLTFFANDLINLSFVVGASNVEQGIKENLLQDLHTFRVLLENLCYEETNNLANDILSIAENEQGFTPFTIEVTE